MTLSFPTILVSFVMMHWGSPLRLDYTACLNRSYWLLLMILTTWLTDCLNGQEAELLKRFPGRHHGGRTVGSDGTFAVLGEHQALDGLGRVTVHDLRTDDDGQVVVPDVAGIQGFGEAISVHDGIALVGAPQSSDTNMPADQPGAAQLLNLRFGGMVMHTFIANDGADGDAFGSAVAIDGRYAAVGAHLHDGGSEAEDSGTVYVFDIRGGQLLWKLVPEEPLEDGQFGVQIDISVSGDRLIALDRHGSASVFSLETGERLLQLLPSNGGSDGGGDVAIDGSLAAVSQLAYDSVFVFDVTTGEELWKRRVVIPAWAFGASLDLNDGILAVGATTLLNGVVYGFDAQSGIQLREVPVPPNEWFPWKGEKNGFGRRLALFDGGMIVGDTSGFAVVWSYEFLPTVGLVGNTLGENLPAGTKIGDLVYRWWEGDVSDLVFEIEDPSGSFQLASTETGGELRSTRPIDFEVDPHFEITIRMLSPDGFAAVTNPQISVVDDRTEDFDGDGLSEADEELTYGTSDLFADSDGDGYLDGWEIARGWDPMSTILQVVGGSDGVPLGMTISGGLLMAGVPSDDAAGNDQGSVRLYDVDPWRALGRLLADDGMASDAFGTALAADSRSVLVGATGDAPAGSAYLFDIFTGREEHVMKPANPGAGDVFGKVVALNDDLVLASARNEARGLVHVFDRDTGMELAPLQGSGRGFGAALAVEGRVALVGSPRLADGEGAGMASVVDLNTREVLASLSPSTATESGFGAAVGIGDSWWVVGSPNGDGGAGAIYVFDRETHALVRRLDPFGEEAMESFGEVLAVDGIRMVVGTWGGAWLYDLQEGFLLTAFGRGAFGEGTIGQTVVIDGSVVGVSGVGAAGHGEMLLYDVPEINGLGLVATSYAQWAEATFSSEDLLNDLVSGLEADPDNDTISNLGEYAFGGDPNRWDDAAAFQLEEIDFENQRLELSYERLKRPEDISYQVWLSSDLELWVPASAYAGLTLVQAGRRDLPMGRERVQLSFAFEEPMDDALMLMLTVQKP